MEIAFVQKNKPPYEVAFIIIKVYLHRRNQTLRNNGYEKQQTSGDCISI